VPTRELTVRIPVDDDLIHSVTQPLANVIAEVIKSEFDAFAHKLSSRLDSLAPPPQPVAASGGVELNETEKQKAADFRMQLLAGKVGDASGLLIDTKSAASLLSVSMRTLRRLADLKAVPEPVRIGSQIRWRLAEILAWIDAGCPPQRYWTYAKSDTPLARRK
jgi:predicted DNA-binding transcriptional regulator AlpA